MLPLRVPLPKPLLADRIRNIQDVKLVGDVSFIDQGSQPATPSHGICWEVEDNRKVVPQNVDHVRKRVVYGKVKGLAQSKIECEAHLTAVRYRKADGEPYQAFPHFASLALPWTRTNALSEMVPRGITSEFRVVQVNSDDHRLYVPIPQEIDLYRQLFVDPGQYEIDIVVTAGSLSKEMTIEVTYTGDWGDLAAVERKRSQLQ